MTMVSQPPVEKLNSNSTLAQIRDSVYKAAGIFQPDNKLQILQDRCLRRMKALGLHSLEDYCDRLTVKPSRHGEMVSLLNEITIGETSFFRNLPQLNALKGVVLTQIVKARQQTATPHLRIWSAGCSSGEEPYTLGMMLLDEIDGHLKGWTFEILATDLNERSIEHCKSGLYREYSTRNVDTYFKDKYFIVRPGGLEVSPVVKSKISFFRVNLLDEARMSAMKGMDVILCCNVLIYFDVASKRGVIRRFYENLSPDGYLFLGHAESLYGVNDDFRLVHLPSATAYVKGQKK